MNAVQFSWVECRLDVQAYAANVFLRSVNVINPPNPPLKSLIAAFNLIVVAYDADVPMKVLVST